MDNKKEKNVSLTNQETFIGEIRTIIDNARSAAIRSVDFNRVQMYWNIGRRIVEEEQHGKERADYGTSGNWNRVGSFIGLTQLRTHCVRN